jgi:hypothetical protein
MKKYYLYIFLMTISMTSFGQSSIADEVKVSKQRDTTIYNDGNLGVKDDYSKLSPSSDASLDTILIDGVPVAGFHPDSLRIEVQLPVSKDSVTLKVLPKSALSDVVVVNYTNLDGTEKERTTTIRVTNGTQSKIYRVTFTKRALDIFIVLGQSNMAGRGPITDAVSEVLPNVKLLADNDQWIAAQNPFNLYSNIRKKASMQRVGPAYSFAKTMEKHTGRPIGMVVNARGGTAISKFSLGGVYHDDLIARLKGLNDFGAIKGIIWHQGESDSGRSSSYMDKLTKLVDILRTELGDARFVAGQMGAWTLEGETSPKYKSINAVISTIESNISNATYVGNADLNHVGDGAHFDLVSQLLLGQRYAQKMLSSEYGIDVSIVKVRVDGSINVLTDSEEVVVNDFYSYTIKKNEATTLTIKAVDGQLIKKIAVNGVYVVGAAGQKEYTVHLTPSDDEITLQVSL